MTRRNAIGYAMLAAPFVAVAGFVASLIGVAQTLIGVAIVAALTVWINVAVELSL